MKRYLLAAFAVMCLLAGCGEGGSGQIQPSQDQAGAKGYHFIFVCPIVQNEYWESCVAGIQTACGELGVTAEVTGPRTADHFSTEIVRYMEEAIEAHPDGILAYSGIQALEPLIERAAEEGIPVLSVDSDAPDTSRVAYVGSDAYNMGVKAGEAMIQLTGGKARIGVLVSSLSAEKEELVLQALRDTVGDYDIEIVAMEETDADPDVAEVKSRQMLLAHPEITALFNTAGYNVTGAARTKQALGLDELILLGFDDVEENLQFVRAGVIDAILVQSPEQMGYRGVYILKEYLDKGRLPRDSYDTGSLLVTRDNVDTYSLSGQTAVEEGKVVRVGYYSGDPSFQSGFSDGERKSGYAYEYYQAISSLTGWRYEYVYGDRTEIMELLAAGEVDIVAGVNRTSQLAQQVFYSSKDMGMYNTQRYFAVSHDRPDLMSELNAAQEKLEQTKPDLTLKLWQQYYGNQTFSQALTEKEWQWLDGKQQLRMGYVGHNLPVSEQGADGMPTGFVKDLMEAVTAYTMIPIKPVCYETVSDMEAALAGGEIDVAFPMYSDLWLAESSGFRQTDPIIKDRVVVIYSGDYKDDLMDRVALSVTSPGQRYYLAKYYPRTETVVYQSRERALEAILQGEERCMAGSSSILQSLLNDSSRYQSLNMAFLDTAEEFGMAVREEDCILVGILNKAVSDLDEATVTAAIMKYSSTTKAVTVEEVLRHYAVYIITALCLFFAILVLVFISYRRRVRAFNAEEKRSRDALEDALLAAKLASESKTTFLSSMSHDIRTPMNAIVGMTAIASQHLDDRSRVEDCLKKIALSSRHLLSLINDILDISKIESGKLSMDPRDLSLRDTVSSLTNIVRPMVLEKHMDLRVHTHHIRYETVHADEVRVNQILVNILTNAIKYTPAGGRVEMSLSQQLLPGGDAVQLTYVVEDSGIGMSPEFMENMYEIFTRAEDTRTAKIQGTGLGLAIVKRIVDMLGGTIECQSREGEGTRFTVTLELALGAQEELPAPEGVRVLLIDEDPVFLEDAGETVRSLGVRADAVTGAAAVPEAVRESCLETTDHVVFILGQTADMTLPETVKAIRQLMGDRPHSILTAAFDWNEAEAGTGEPGADGSISKPLFRSALSEAFCALTQGRLDPGGEAEAERNVFEGLRFLVAEDNDINWEVICELLGMSGIGAQRAENGQICVDMLKASPPGAYDMVLMDVQMPVLNGWDATRAIRGEPREDLREIPIVAMTADAFAEDVATSMGAGMNGHVSKPVDMSVLLQEVRRLLHL